jgi:phage/plasmid-associated DNA primase
MPRNSKNGKVSADTEITTSEVTKIVNRVDTFEFLIYPGVNSRKLPHKDAVTAACNKLITDAKKGNNRFQLRVGIKALIETLNTGITLQTGITSKTCQADDIDRHSILIVDYDAKLEDGSLKPNALTLDELLKLPLIKEYCSLYQASLSGFPNTHFVILLTEDVTHKEVIALNKYVNDSLTGQINEMFGDDKHGFDKAVSTNAMQLYYTGKEDCRFIKRTPGLDSEYPLMDSKKWIDEASQLGYFEKPVKKFAPNISRASSSTNATQQDSPSTGITEQFLKYFWEQVSPKIDDFTDVFNLYDHAWKYNDGAKAKGSNPFSPTNKTGTSFVVFYDSESGLCPRFLDGSKNLKAASEDDVEKNTIIEYYYYLGRMEGKYLNGGIQKQFWNIVRDICKDWKIPDFKSERSDFKGKTIDWLCNQLCEDLQTTLYIAKFKGLEGSAIYYYFDGETYDTYCLSELIKRLKTIANKSYPEVEKALIERAMNEKAFKFRGLYNEMFSWFSTNEAPLKAFNHRPDVDWRYFPFSNGLYDCLDKVLIPNDGRGFNTEIIRSEYFHVEDNNPGVLALKKWLKEWMKLDVKADYLLSYSIICSQGKANHIKTFPLIYGLKGTGKSTFSSTISGLFPKDLRLTSNSKQPLNPSDNHGLASLENKFLWTIKELKHSDNTDLDKLLDFFGEDNASECITINPKNQETREVPKLFGLIADSENIPSLPKGKEGFYRRFKFMESSFMPEAKDLIAVVNEHKESIFNWMLQQDFNIHKAIIQACEGHEYFKERATQVQKENSDLSFFIEECFDITNDEKDVHLFDDLYKLFCQSATMNHEKVHSKRVFSRYFKKSLTAFEWVENCYESNSKVKYRGFKCKPDIRAYSFSSEVSNF